MRITKSNQEKNEKKNYKKVLQRVKRQIQGITLIALVVTIIVLLILAGVEISLTVGDNGLFRRAENAADTWQEASEREAIELAVAGMQIGSMQETGMTKQELENSLKEQFGDEASVEDNEDGSFLVTIGENQYYLGEDGEIIDSSNMVEISTAEELKVFRDDVNSGNTYEGWYVYLANDITLDINEEWEPIGLYYNDSSSPENENNKPFKGIFNGNNYQVNGIKIDTSNKCQGMFGLVNKAIIKNLKAGKNNAISGELVTASIVSYAYNGSKIYNCHNETNIVGNGKSTGGIVGVANMNVVVEKCSNKADIIGKDDNVGGIVGNCINESIVNSSFNTGNIYGEKNIVGGCIGTAQSGCQIVNNYNIGEIHGNNNYLGGIIGLLTDSSTLANCYNIGNVIGGLNCINGVAGDVINDSNISNSYFLENIVNDANGTSTNEGVIIKNSEELKILATILGTAFKNDITDINNGYPILNWQ